MDLKEKVRFVNDFDCWTQENNKWLDRQLGIIYSKATYNSDGWQGIAEHDHDIFEQAYELVKKNHYLMEDN